MARRARDASSASFRRSSARSSTCSSARPSTSRTRASASSRSRRWRSGSRSSTTAARCAARRSSRRTSCAPCARRGCGRRARRADSRSSRSGRSARTARPISAPGLAPRGLQREAGRGGATTTALRSAAARAIGVRASADSILQVLRRRMARETTLVLVKPDGMRRGLAGEIVARFERRGLELRGARLLKIPKATARSTTPSTRASRSSGRWSTSSRRGRFSRSP